MIVTIEAQIYLTQTDLKHIIHFPQRSILGRQCLVLEDGEVLSPKVIFLTPNFFAESALDVTSLKQAYGWR